MNNLTSMKAIEIDSITSKKILHFAPKDFPGVIRRSPIASMTKIAIKIHATTVKNISIFTYPPKLD